MLYKMNGGLGFRWGVVYMLVVIAIMVADIADAQKITKTLSYHFPEDGSIMVSPDVTIILRSLQSLDSRKTDDYLKIKVNGDINGDYITKTILTRDGRTFVTKADDLFFPGENIRVQVYENGNEKQISEFSFTISQTLNSTNLNIQHLKNKALEEETEKEEPAWPTAGKAVILNGVAIPGNFPLFKPSISKTTAPGYIFVNNWIGSPYIMILKNDGTPWFYKRVRERSRDFKVQPTGVLTRRVRSPIWGFVSMDKAYNELDTFLCQNGYGTDEHELQLLPNGNALLIALDYQEVDMSKMVEGGNPGVRVIGNHVQEIDPDKNVVFEWRSWDHFNIPDAIHEDLTRREIDYVHMNSIAVDYDGNLLISSRHLSECTKINHETGEIIWRLGGVHNQFNFTNDPEGFNYQHDFRPVPGVPGNYTLFDNGNFHSPVYSRAVEYKLDTEQMTAEKVWEYRHEPDRFSHFMGNVQRLPNGNTLINWADMSLPKATEVTPEGEVVYEGDFVFDSHCYRTFRFEWDGMMEQPYLLVESHPHSVTLIYNKFGDEQVKEYRIYAAKSPAEPVFFTSTSQTLIELTDIGDPGEYCFQVSAVDNNGNESGLSNKICVNINFIEPGSNLVNNGDFERASIYWDLDVSAGAMALGEIEGSTNIYKFDISNGGSDWSDIQLRQFNIPVIYGRTYIFSFDAYADADRIIEVKITKAEEPWTNYGKIGPTAITPRDGHYEYEFTMDDPTDLSALIVINCGGSAADVYIDNIELREKVEVNEEQIYIPVKNLNIEIIPNPADASADFCFSLHQPRIIQIKLYNALGVEVLKGAPEYFFTGNNRVNLDISHLESGMYFYNLNSFLNGKQITLYTGSLFKK